MTTRSLLAAAAALLGLLAGAAGDPVPAGPSTAVAAAVDRSEGRVGVIELARWIRARRPDLLLVDLRPPEDFADFRLPGARNQGLPALVSEPPQRGRIVVVYAAPGPLAAQAWVLLKARGWARVFYLDAGVASWLDGILNPTLPDDATPAERARWPEVQELSRYFGGLPARGGPRPAHGHPAWFDDPTGGSTDRPSVDLTRRRGCGF